MPGLSAGAGAGLDPGLNSRTIPADNREVMNLTWVIGLLAVWVLLRFGLRPFLALVFAKSIGAQALARVPATVQLTRTGDGAWSNADAARRMWEPLLTAGFADAGTYTVNEMPGVVMRLLASSTDSILAIAYEHPRAGHWLELVTRYADGRRCSATSLVTAPMTAPEFVTTLRVGNAPPLRLLETMRRQRPEGTMLPVTTADVTRMFEEGYAESMKWHREHGVGRRDVVKVAMRRAA